MRMRVPVRQSDFMFKPKPHLSFCTQRNKQTNNKVLHLADAVRRAAVGPLVRAGQEHTHTQSHTQTQRHTLEATAVAAAVKKTCAGPEMPASLLGPVCFHQPAFARFQSSALCEGTSEMATATGCEAPNSARVSISPEAASTATTTTAAASSWPVGFATASNAGELLPSRFAR